MYSLRPYQQAGAESIREAFRMGAKAVCFTAPTGSGKTCILSYITYHAALKGNRVIILVHRQELLTQCSRSLTEMDVPHGIIASGKPVDQTKMVQVASVGTLVRRLPNTIPPDLLVIDEAHHCVASQHRKIVTAFSKARVLGVTATPLRLDGKGLREIFDTLVIGPTTDSLIKEGWLCRPVYYAPPGQVDVTGMHRVGGDFNRKEAGERADKPVITGCAVKHYSEICHGSAAIAFCVSIKHAEHVAAEFNAAGISSAVIDGTLSDAERADRVASLADGRIKVLCSCEIVSEGFDLPAVTAAILLRPTASMGLHLQQVGRALRLFPGKTRAIILDHVGNTGRHGFAEDAREWSLDGAESHGKRAQEAPIPTRTCPKCYAVHRPAPVCPLCGHYYEAEAREVEQVDGKLVEIDRLRAMAERKQAQARARSYEELVALGTSRGYAKPHAWAWIMMKARERKGQHATRKQPELLTA